MKKHNTFLPISGTGSARHGTKWWAHFATLRTYKDNGKVLDKHECEVKLWARKNGQCEACGCRTEEGQKLYWLPQTKIARHVGCTSTRYEALIAEHVAAIDEASNEARKSRILAAIALTLETCKERRKIWKYMLDELGKMHRITIKHDVYVQKHKRTAIFKTAEGDGGEYIN